MVVMYGFLNKKVLYTIVQVHLVMAVSLQAVHLEEFFLPFALLSFCQRLYFFLPIALISFNQWHYIFYANGFTYFLQQSLLTYFHLLLTFERRLAEWPDIQSQEQNPPSWWGRPNYELGDFRCKINIKPHLTNWLSMVKIVRQYFCSNIFLFGSSV